MSKTFDISIDALVQRRHTRAVPQSAIAPLFPISSDENPTVLGAPNGSKSRTKAFYIQKRSALPDSRTAHDFGESFRRTSGPRLSRQWQLPPRPISSSIYNNACSIREKAAHKVFSRLGEWRTAAQAQYGQVIGQKILGCLAQQERRRGFRARARGSAWCAARQATKSCLVTNSWTSSESGRTPCW